MDYTYKLVSYESSRTGNKLIDEVVDIEKYALDTNQYAENINEYLWQKRFTYMRNIKSILYPDYDVSIYEFMKTIDNIDSSNIKTIVDVYNIVDKISIKYADWCISKDKNRYSFDDMKKFCGGAIGEYVWQLFLKYNKKIRLSENNHQTEYTFYNICMRKDDDMDLGVDNIGEVEINGKNKHNCIFQFKFWNPNITTNEMTLKLIQGVHDDGNNGFITKQTDEVNTFICWLGTEKNVSNWIKKSYLNNNIKFIDINTIKINNSEEICRNIINKINNIKNLG